MPGAAPDLLAGHVGRRRLHAVVVPGVGLRVVADQPSLGMGAEPDAAVGSDHGVVEPLLAHEREAVGAQSVLRGPGLQHVAVLVDPVEGVHPQSAVAGIDVALELAAADPVALDDVARVDVDAEEDRALLAELAAPEDVDAAPLVARHPAAAHPAAHHRTAHVEEHTHLRLPRFGVSRYGASQPPLSRKAGKRRTWAAVPPMSRERSSGARSGKTSSGSRTTSP